MRDDPRREPREEPVPTPEDWRKPYPVDDPGISDPDGPGSEPDYLPPPTPPEPVRFRALGLL